MHKLRFVGLFASGDVEISPAHSVLVVCGANGVGKSTILRSIAAAMDSALLHSRDIVRMSGARVELSLSEAEAGAFQATFGSGTPLDPGWSAGRTLFCDPSADVRLLQQYYRAQENFDELLAQNELREVPTDARERIEYLVGRDYASIAVSEITDSTVRLRGVDVVPYFRVTSGGRTYGAESMGHGEFSLHLLHWLLMRAEEGSVVLIEEPENYIAPRSQQHIGNVIAHFADEKKLSVILTTHSPAIVEVVPRSAVVLLVRQGGNHYAASAPSDADLRRAIGFVPRERRIILVEDRVAADLLYAILERYAPGIRAIARVSPVGLEGVLKGVAHSYAGEDMHIAGVLDGDQSVAHRGTKGIAFLPGKVAPESLLRRAATDDAQLLAAVLHRDPIHIASMLGSIEGIDRHDWYEELRKDLGVSGVELAHALLAVWASDPSNESEAKRLVESLGALLAVTD